MKQLTVKPELFLFEKCGDFVEQFQIGADDFILTNRYIFEPFFGSFNLKANILFQENYGSGEPSDEMAEAIAVDIQGNPKRVIAIGGGTIIDLAKLYALRNVTPVLELFDMKFPLEKEKELIIVPTTCGTGSEMTNISILELKSRQTKKGLAADSLYADSAVLIPELLRSLPYPVFVASSMDALIHAMESSVSPKSTPYTKLFGYEAIRIILNGYRKIATDGEEARFPRLADFLIASNYAGIAFGNAGVGAVHAMSYPFSGKYHVPHGEANSTLFIGIFHYYMTKSQSGSIAELNLLLAEILDCHVDEVYHELETLLNKIFLRKSLREYGVTPEDLTDFTQNVIDVQGRLMANNFVPLDFDDILRIYQSLY